jgi:hypothetical protein
MLDLAPVSDPDPAPVPENQELHRDTLYIGVETDKGIYRVGTLSYIIETGNRKIYEFDIDPERHKTALEISGSLMLPGFDPDYGWKQRHDKEIYFIYERAFHTKRSDLEEVLKPWGMKRKDYSKWGFVKVTRGAYLDKWRVTPCIEETS